MLNDAHRDAMGTLEDGVCAMKCSLDEAFRHFRNLGRVMETASGADGAIDDPAVARKPVDEFPAAREVHELITGIRWSEVRSWLRAGEAVSICVGKDHLPALLDAAQQLCGVDVLLRVTRHGVLWLVRPEVLCCYNDADGE